MKRLLVALVVLAALGQNVKAQSRLLYESLASPEHQEHILSFLADDITEGRQSGVAEQVISSNFIIRSFKNAGLRPFNWSYTQSFHYDPTVVLHNVWGVVPAIIPTDEYIVVSAHYDHLGILNGVVYNGADDNASGVTALVSLAEMFCRMRKDGIGLMKNILFVAFDGKELSMAGSDYFVEQFPHDKYKIVCNINMDILGSTLAPIDKARPDYLIVLGENTLPQQYRGLVDDCNKMSSLNLHLDHTFYGSAGFTQMMLELGDHYSFAKKGIPALLFTSGFHDYTYKPTDDVDIIDFSILSRRTLLIFNVIRQLAL